jgi:hypothetical protein
MRKRARRVMLVLLFAFWSQPQTAAHAAPASFSCPSTISNGVVACHLVSGCTGNLGCYCCGAAFAADAANEMSEDDCPGGRWHVRCDESGDCEFDGHTC